MAKPELLNNQGEMLRRKGKLQQALHHFEKAIELIPKYSDAWGNRALTLFQLGRLAEAKDSIARAIDLGPRNPNNWNIKATILMKEMDFDGAEACLRMAVSINPRFHPALGNLGEVLRIKHQWDEAKTYYDLALSIDNHVEAPWIGKGQIASAEGKVSEAISYFNKAIEVHPRHPVAWNDKGAALAVTGDLLGAETSFDMALTADPNFADAVGNKGEVSRRLGKLSEAEVYINRAIQMRPGNPNNWNNKGALLSGQGKLEEALECFQRALSISPSHPDALSNKIGVLGQLGRFDEAERLSTELATAALGPQGVFEKPFELYVPGEIREPAVRPKEVITDFQREIVGASLVALRGFGSTKPLYVQDFVSKGRELLETYFRDDFKRSLEPRFESVGAECKYGDGLADIRIQSARKPTDSIVFEFKIWGRNDYLEVVRQVLRYVTPFENCAAVVMINSNKTGLGPKYVERVIEASESFVPGSIIVQPFHRPSNFDHYSSDHRTEAGRIVRIFHFVLDLYN